MRLKKWKITLYSSEKCDTIIFVDAPNRMFARWNARDVVGHMAWMEADKITCSVVID